MIIFLTVFLIVLIVGIVAAKYFAAAVPFLGALKAPLIIACIVVSVLLAIFVAIEIYNAAKGKK